ncbi:hypothetical protein BOTBODRAFT_59496 [Botryobasidium botryosum FD-172 SS1]|uniref:Uncharacterized protein n=1 Tax=Botryobasidium botryosum (strain FD-172 SS1) TaxID=930990 RepID=A0A067LY28_BOTB1|nr:hypothetical protein BOTBODRAFT_59496 [Botryobasidium botryosum FD-172 SS1]
MATLQQKDSEETNALYEKLRTSDGDALDKVIVDAITSALETGALDSVFDGIRKFFSERSSSVVDPPQLSVLDLLPFIRRSMPLEGHFTQDLVNLIGEYASPREILVAVEEALEHIRSVAESEEEGEDEHHDSTAQELILLMSLSALSIPRQPLRRRTHSGLLAAYVTPISDTIECISTTVPEEEKGRLIIASVSDLIIGLAQWAKDVPDSEDAQKCRRILNDLLLRTLSVLVNYVNSALAERKFEDAQPKLTVQSRASHTKTDWVEGAKSMQKAVQAWSDVNSGPGDIFNMARSPIYGVGVLTLIAHSKWDIDVSAFASVLPTLIASFSFVVDESLALLITFTYQRSSMYALSDENAQLLIPALSSLASQSPDSQTRYIAFRIISQILSRSKPEFRLYLVRELLTDCPIPQMRSAAVGLAKEAVLDAFKVDDRGVLAMILPQLAPSILRHDPPDMFDPLNYPGLSDFLESPEPSRLTECLGFYYVVIQRDTSNLTGIRNAAQIRDTEKEFLAPLRTALRLWQEEINDSTAPQPAMMRLFSLEMALEKVDESLAALVDPGVRGA